MELIPLTSKRAAGDRSRFGHPRVSPLEPIQGEQGHPGRRLLFSAQELQGCARALQGSPLLQTERRCRHLPPGRVRGEVRQQRGSEKILRAIP